MAMDSKIVTTVGVHLTEDERRHLTSLCNELEVMEESALRRSEGPEAQTRAAERDALRKLMNLPAASAISSVSEGEIEGTLRLLDQVGCFPVTADPAQLCSVIRALCECMIEEGLGEPDPEIR